MKITEEWLNKHHACYSGLRWFTNRTLVEHQDVIHALIEDRQLEWALWLCSHLLSNSNNIRALNLYAAKLVAPAFRKAEGDKALRLRFSKMLDNVKHAQYALASRKAMSLIRHTSSSLGHFVVSAFYYATRSGEHQRFWALNFILNAAYQQGTKTGCKIASQIIKRGLELIDKEEKT